MIHGLYLSAAGALVQDARMDVIANNIANTSTPGFKGDFALFMQRAHEALEKNLLEYADPLFRDKVGGGVFLRATQTNYAKGVLDHTENPFNVAVDSEGFLAVSDGDETYYTRNGSFTLTRDGSLKTLNGYYDVLSSAGVPIKLNTDLSLKIHRSGDLEQGGVIVGKLGVATFSNLDKLRKFGRTLFKDTGQDNVTLGEGRVSQ